MQIVDYKVDPELYARLYSDLKIKNTLFLAYRDLPQLINKYVTGKKTLDYGSGAGNSTIYLKSLGLEVIGVDINPKMIDIIKSVDSKGDYHLIKSGEIPYPDNYFDFVFSSFAFLEVGSKEELVKISKDIKRVLKPDGVFITIVCIEDFYNRDWLSLNSQFPENQNLVSGSVVKVLFKDIGLIISDYFWSADDFLEVFHKAGLRLITNHKPLGTEKDGYEWVTEKEISPFVIYVVKP